MCHRNFTTFTETTNSEQTMFTNLDLTSIFPSEIQTKSKKTYPIWIGFFTENPYLFLVNNRSKVIKLNAVNAKNGMVIKPNQLIYSVLHGTPFLHGLIAAKPGTFCSK